MSDEPGDNTAPRPATAVEVDESCRCGASTTLKGADLADTTLWVKEWRTGHRCASPSALDGAGKTGASSALLSPAPPARIGFGAAPEVHGPWR